MRCTVCFVLIVLALLPLCAPAQILPDEIQEDFSGLTAGSDGSPSWLPGRGTWTVSGEGYRQTSEEYDCVSFFALPASGSFSVEIVFRHIAGEPGAGIIFSAAGGAGVAYGHMGRFDGATTFIAGRFLAGEFTATGSVRTDSIQPGVEHRLRVDVDRERHLFAFSLDGSTILSDQRLEFASGKFALESSGGSVLFHSVAIRHHAVPASVTALDWIERFDLLPNSDIAVPDVPHGTVSILDSSGTFLRSLGQTDGRSTPFVRPFDVHAYGKSTILVTDTVTQNVHVVSLNDGRILHTIGRRGSLPGEFQQPVAVATDGSGRIYVVDRLNNRVQVFSRDLTFAHTIGGDRLRLPTDIAIDDDRLFILNTGLCQVEEYTLSGGSAIWKKSISYGGGLAGGIASKDGALYISIVQELRKYAPPYTSYSAFRGRASGFMAPRAISLDRGGNVAVADMLHGRILVIDSQLTDPGPSFLEGPDGITVRWSSNCAGEGYLQSADSIYRAARESETGSFSATVPHSSQVRHIRITPAVRSIPPDATFGLPYPLPPVIPPGTGAYVRLPLLVLFITDVRDDRTPAPTDPPAVTGEELARVRRQIEDGVRFYWIHSGFRFHLDVTTLVVPERMRRSEVYGSEWWYPPRESLLTAALRSRGMSSDAFTGVLYLTFTQVFDSTTHRFVLNGKGGGFTSGVGTGKGYGISWWEVTREHHNAGNNWLMVHEFNHQLDDIFAASGYPEYWFNHISPTIGTAANFGEHFDANAHILRIVPPDEWLDLKFTTLRTFGDRDMDGIPDNEPGLPLDERRLGSSPASADSDGDGIPDVTEVTRSNWIAEGWGEDYSLPANVPSLTSTDTDADGIPDGADPEPLSALVTTIPAADATHPPFTDMVQIGTARDTGFSTTWYARWDSAEFRLDARVSSPAELKVMIDANSDGWFLGRDNILVTTSLPDSAYRLRHRVQVFNGAHPDAWPSMDSAAAVAIGLISSVVRDGQGMRVSLRFKQSVSSGLIWESGKKIGLSLAARPASRPIGTRYISLVEPNRFFHVTFK